MVCQYQSADTNQIPASGGSAADKTERRETLHVIESCLFNQGGTSNATRDYAKYNQTNGRQDVISDILTLTNIIFKKQQNKQKTSLDS